MIPRAVKASLLRNYLQRNFEQMTSGMGTVEAWRSYLQSVTGSTSSNIANLEAQRLDALGFTGTLSDRWRRFLNSEGYGSLSMGDGLRAYFTANPSDLTLDGTLGGISGQPIGLLLALTYA